MQKGFVGAMVVSKKKLIVGVILIAVTIVSVAVYNFKNNTPDGEKIIYKAPNSKDVKARETKLKSISKEASNLKFNSEEDFKKFASLIDQAEKAENL
jgi:hypothetical protein